MAFMVGSVAPGRPGTRAAAENVHPDPQAQDIESETEPGMDF